MKIKKLISGFAGGLLLGIIFFYITWSLYEHENYKQQLRQNVVYWKSIVGSQPNYPDGWVKLAINWYKLGENEFAKLAIEKAEKLDPINDSIKDIKRRLR